MFLVDFFGVCRQYADGRSTVIQDPGCSGRRQIVESGLSGTHGRTVGPIGAVVGRSPSWSGCARFCWSDEENIHRCAVYWLFLTGTDHFYGGSPTGEHEPPAGVFLILATLLPDDPNTCYSVPCVHNTVGQDLSSIMSQKVVRSSYYDRGRKTWPPSTRLYGRMVHPPSSIRQPMLTGSDRFFQSFCLYLCFSWVCGKVEVRKVNVKVRQVCFCFSAFLPCFRFLVGLAGRSRSGRQARFCLIVSVFVDNMQTAPEVLVSEDVPKQVTCK